MKGHRLREMQNYLGIYSCKKICFSISLANAGRIIKEHCSARNGYKIEGLISQNLCINIGVGFQVVIVTESANDKGNETPSIKPGVTKSEGMREGAGVGVWVTPHPSECAMFGAACAAPAAPATRSRHRSTGPLPSGPRYGQCCARCPLSLYGFFLKGRWMNYRAISGSFENNWYIFNFQALNSPLPHFFFEILPPDTTNTLLFNTSFFFACQFFFATVFHSKNFHE